MSGIGFPFQGMFGGPDASARGLGVRVVLVGERLSGGRLVLVPAGEVC